MDIQTLNQSMVSILLANHWIIVMVIWSIVWKLIALWKTARNNQLTLFIVFAVLNTLGIAEIVYLIYMYIKEKKQKSS